MDQGGFDTSPTFFASLFYFIQETLNRRIPPDGDGAASRVAGMQRGGEARNVERFEYIVDGGRLDEEARRENNGACISWRAGPRVRVPQSVLIIKEFPAGREKMSTSYLMIPDSCAPTAGGSGVLASVLHVSVPCGSL